jgi:integrase
MVRYSRQDALTEREVVRMLQKTWKMDDEKRAFETRLVIHCAARLGMRAGEIAHLNSSWISWSQKTINIPPYQKCTQGKNGERCGYCRNRARDYADTNDVSFEEALDKYWNPKTKNAERTIPFDFNVRTEICIEKFDREYDKFPISKATINRRINRISEKCNIQRVYPHSLRATAATIHASRNISPYSLMSVMGWQSMDTARTYISSSDESAARELRHKYR